MLLVCVSQTGVKELVHNYVTKLIIMNAILKSNLSIKIAHGVVAWTVPPLKSISP